MFKIYFIGLFNTSRMLMIILFIMELLPVAETRILGWLAAFQVEFCGAPKILIWHS